jgi:hypothetical protein
MERVPGSKEGAPDGQVVPLGRSPAAEGRLPPPSRPGRLHGLAIAGMAFFALAGIASMLSFVTIHWPGPWGRYVIAVFVGSVVAFLACGSTAVLTAARDTYANRSERPGSR